MNAWWSQPIATKRRADGQRGYAIIGVLIATALMLFIGLVTYYDTASEAEGALERRTLSHFIVVQNAVRAYAISNAAWPSSSNGLCTNILATLVTQHYIDNDVLTAQNGSPYFSTGCTSGDHQLWLRHRERSHGSRQYDVSLAGVADQLPFAQTVTGSGGTDIVSYMSRSSLANQITGQIVQTMTYKSNQDNLVDKPTCPTGFKPEIFASIAGMSASQKAPSIGAAYVTATSISSRQWRIRGQLTTTAGKIDPPGNRMPMLVTTMCASLANTSLNRGG